MKIILFGKNNKPGIKEVIEYLNIHFKEVKTFLGERKEESLDINEKSEFEYANFLYKKLKIK